MRIGIYARVSTADQTCQNQLDELRNYVAARGWDTAVEYVDHGVSGTRESRPALDQLTRDLKRRKIDVVVCWRLDRLGRDLKHLVTLIDEWQTLGVAFISLAEGIDATTPSGKLQLHVLAAIAEFERGRLVERIRAGLDRARRNGTKLGRRAHRISDHDLAMVSGLSLRAAAAQLKLPRSVVHRARQRQTAVAA